MEHLIPGLPDDPGIADPIEVVERLEALLDFISQVHARGMAWGGLDVAVDALVSLAIDPVSLLGEEPEPRRLMAEAAAADLRDVRRLVAFAYTTLRAEGVPAWLGNAVASALIRGQTESTARSMRDSLFEATLDQLRRVRRSISRQIDTAGSVDVRLDAWSHTGGAGPPGMRAFVGVVLNKKNVSAESGRARLGTMVEDRELVDDAIERITARRDGCIARRRPSTAPICIMAPELDDDSDPDPPWMD